MGKSALELLGNSGDDRSAVNLLDDKAVVVKSAMDLLEKPPTSAPATAPPPSFIDRIFGLVSKPTEKSYKVPKEELPLPKGPEDYPADLDIEEGFPEAVIKKPLDLFDLQLESTKPFTGEVSPTEIDPIITEEFKQGITETLSGYWELAKNPYNIVRGAADFVTSIPGFLVGIGVAGQRMSKNVLDQVVLGQTFDLEELYNVAVEGMEDSMKFFEPGKELIVGKTPQEAQLVGATAMAPLTGLSMIGHSVANWQGFEDYPNIRGTARFAGDISGLLAMGMIYRGVRAELSRDVEGVTRKANDIKAKEQLIEKTPDESIQRAQVRILEVQKKQLELEAIRLKEKIEKGIDLEKPIKRDLKEKGKEVREKKAKAVDEEYIYNLRNVEDPFYHSPSLQKKLSAKGVQKGYGDLIFVEPKSELSFAKGKADLERVVLPRGYKELSVDKLATDAGYKSFKDVPIDKRVELANKAFDSGVDVIEGGTHWRAVNPKLERVKEVTVKKKKKVVIKPEKIPEKHIEEALDIYMKGKEVDTQTGLTTEFLEGEKSPFFQNKVETEGFKKVFEGRKIEDVETYTQHLLNRVNRWYHGEELDIVELRDNLSKVAARADEFRADFLNPSDHLQWKDTVSEAARWTRTLDRLKIERRGVKFYSGIPIDKVANQLIRLSKKGMTLFTEFDSAKIDAFRGVFRGLSFAKRLDILATGKLKPVISDNTEMLSTRLRSVREWYKKGPERAAKATELFDKLQDKTISPSELDSWLALSERDRIEASNLYYEAKNPDSFMDQATTGIILEDLPKGKVSVTLYGGIPAKEIIAAGKKFISYFDKATGVKKFKPTDAARLLNQEFKRNFVDRSGNIRLELLDKLGMEGYKIVQKMYLTKGANSLAANMLKQMQKEVYGGLTKTEKTVLDKVILAERMADIGKYKTPKEFKYPEGLTPAETAIYLELFPQLEKLRPDRAQAIQDRARAYFEWMKQPLKDLLDAQIISKEEFDALSAHNYRKIKLVDIFDRRYEGKLGKRKPRSIYDSGVEALAKGRDTDIYETSSEIMALEVFNRSYGRILNNEANLSLLELAKNDPKNPFVRFKKKGENIPSGWQRIFVYEGGERKAIHISPTMAKEWIYSDPMIKYRMGQFLRFTSLSPVLRTFATGINWGFALANLPRDVMHTWFAARMFDGKEWKGVYSNQLPIFLPQIGLDLARTFTDAATRGKRYQEYIKEGGGMEFLVHQGRIFARGRRLEGPLDKMQNFMGYFGETSEIMTRLAIRERVIRRRAKQEGISMEEARKRKEITREATFAARDYMDFGQGGGITKAADNAMPYLNAATQGTRGLWRTANDNPKLFAYKVAQIGAATTLLYAAMREHAPKTTEELQGSIAMQNNFCVPLGDTFSFKDEKGQERYIYFKVPLDPGQKFFKAFFEGAYDKYAGYEVDVDRLTNNLLEQSPVGVSSLPPSLTGTLGYMSNKDFWLNEDIWKKTKEPFSYPRSREEFIPGKTSEVYKDVGDITGLSPERGGYAVEQITTRGTIWSYLMGKGYEKLFADVPDEKREQHIAMVLAEMPVLKRFIGITNPYSKYATKIDEAQEKADLEHWIQNRELDRLTDGHLFEDSVERKDIFKYIRTFPKKEVRDRLTERFDFQYAIRKLPERSFWLRLQGLKNPAKAEIYYGRWKAADEEERKQLAREAGIIGAAGGVLSSGFWDEFSRVRREDETE